MKVRYALLNLFQEIDGLRVVFELFDFSARAFIRPFGGSRRGKGSQPALLSAFRTVFDAFGCFIVEGLREFCRAALVGQSRDKNRKGFIFFLNVNRVVDGDGLGCFGTNPIDQNMPTLASLGGEASHFVESGCP